MVLEAMPHASKDYPVFERSSFQPQVAELVFNKQLEILLEFGMWSQP